MTDVRQMKAKVEAAIKRADPKTMTETFYDGASDRLFVTIVKGWNRGKNIDQQLFCNE